MRIKIKNKIYVFTRPLEFGEGTKTEDLWHAGYAVCLRKVCGIKFLMFVK